MSVATPADTPARVLPGITPAGGPHEPGTRLGDVIVALGFAEREAVETTVLAAREDGRPIGRALIEAGLINSDQLARALAERNSLDHVDLNVFEIDMGAANLVTAAEAQRYRAIPIAFLSERTLLVATADPANVLGLDNIGMATGYEVRPAIASPEDLFALVGQLSQLSESVQEIDDAEPEPEPVLELRESANDAPVVKLVRSLIGDAVHRGASDIHYDPRDGDMRVRFRIDGVVISSTTVPQRLVPGLISRIKIMADLDIAERRAPQDGRCGLSVDGREIDIRIVTLPVMRGEAAVMRILDKSRMAIELDRLGMSDRDREMLERALTRVHGAILVTGPTGAGKTTTLYAALAEANTPERTLIAIEDPVEYELDGVKQIQVNPKAGLSFAAGLRSMIRADPDVLMVGEIRDPETAQIAIQSALTGHLMLSTLHTNVATMAPARLIDMGIEPFLIASGVECVIAQRLARRLCDDCKRPVRLPAADLERSGFGNVGGDVEAFEPVGCVRCNSTGFRGRVGLFEVMTLDDELRSLIVRKASADELAAAAAAGGMRSLRDDGLAKVRAGITSAAEILRALGS